MFKKKIATSGDEDSSCRTVVTETVKTEGGVVTTTKTTVMKSGNKEDFESAFKNFNLEPSRMTETRMVKKVVYASSGENGAAEETVETYETTADGLKDSKSPKHSKGLAERLGFKSKSKERRPVEAVSSEKSLPAVKPGKFEDDCLKSHNSYRAKHGVPSLKLSKQLCAYSKEWADHLAATDKFQHRTERKYGENIFMKWSSDPNHTVSGNEAVDSWYSEIKDYTFGKEPTTLKSGHFTQVIWKESSELGVAWARSSTGKILVVANYSPAGNFVGRFTQNVPPPKK